VKRGTCARTGLAVAVATFSILVGVVCTTRALASDPPGSAAAPRTTEHKATARRIEGMLILHRRLEDEVAQIES